MYALLFNNKTVKIEPYFAFNLFIKNIIFSNNAIYFCYFNFIYFNLRLLLTTDTELNAIAAPANIGFNKKPLIG